MADRLGEGGDKESSDDAVRVRWCGGVITMSPSNDDVAALLLSVALLPNRPSVLVPKGFSIPASGT